MLADTDGPRAVYRIDRVKISEFIDLNAAGTSLQKGPYVISHNPCQDMCR
jgi:hypothetical protein